MTSVDTLSSKLLNDWKDNRATLEDTCAEWASVCNEPRAPAKLDLFFCSAMFFIESLPSLASRVDRIKDLAEGLKVFQRVLVANVSEDGEDGLSNGVKKMFATSQNLLVGCGQYQTLLDEETVLIKLGMPRASMEFCKRQQPLPEQPAPAV
jgi:hypothetical protein